MTPAPARRGHLAAPARAKGSAGPGRQRAQRPRGRRERGGDGHRGRGAGPAAAGAGAGGRCGWGSRSGRSRPCGWAVPPRCWCAPRSRGPGRGRAGVRRDRRPWLIVGRVEPAGRRPGLAGGRRDPGPRVPRRHVDETTVEAGAAEPMPVLAQRWRATTWAGWLRVWRSRQPRRRGAHERRCDGTRAARGARRRGRRPAGRRRTPAAPGRGGPGHGHRHTELPADAVVVRARLVLRHADPAALAEERAAFKRWRREHQPGERTLLRQRLRHPAGDSAGA